VSSGFLAIVGPTASGKTDLALRLANEQNAEIISVDSRQIYKYLSIGTAKPLETRGIPYHLIDFLEPDKPFSAADFLRLANEKLKGIQARGKTPIFAGGTGLYFKALTEGLADLPPADSAVRDRLKKEADEKGRAGLHARLSEIDPDAASKIPANNIQRVIRALEVFELTGKPISEWHREHKQTDNKVVFPAKAGIQNHGLGPDLHRGDVKINFIGLDPGREELIHRIETRCQQMMSGGMIEETQDLLQKGFSESCPALSGLGYPRIIAFLKGKLSKDECLALLIQDTRQYAKRQRTWFRHQFDVKWNSL
jgi:tRNA dimethylallyltransferase